MASTSTAGSKRKIEDMGAFDAFAPSESTYASKINKKPSYDVFINHRGPDVKYTLASALYGILTGMALSVFLDSEELEYGDLFPRTIEAAIASALLHVAIFSKGYAESPWCLAELQFMLKSGAPIFPIFYHVEPTDLRYLAQGKGEYVNAFKVHEEKGRYSKEQLQEWKDALYNASFYTGQIIKTKEDEMRLQKNIVNCVLKVINYVPLVVAKHPVGLEEIVQDFEMNTLQSAGGDQDVRIVGIWGMGGSGKTTLAKELYNKRFSSMDSCSFIFDVRDGAAKDQLQNKQIQLLNDLGVKNVTLHNIEQGKAILTRRLRSIRVLFVFDDVDHKDQLDALLPVKDSLGGGSLIIVTTREFEVLRSWGISSIYKMRGLDPSFAKQLFCWHAFLQSFPSERFEELVEMFVKVCNGLPLSLKVFGGQLYGESRKEYWESLLDKISRRLPDDIKNILKISYDALDVEEKEMFLDTACFFIGEEISLAIDVWNGFGWSGYHGWETLQNKCLVEFNTENKIKMHDHLRDLGREIANQRPPYRIWSPQQIITAEKQIEKRNAIRGIVADQNKMLWQYQGEPMCNTYGAILSPAPSLAGLKILVIRGGYCNQIIGEISRELVWLRWVDIRQRNLLSQLSLKNLTVLELCDSADLEELWEADNDAPIKLRVLIISRCYKFQRFPSSIGCLKELRKIVIGEFSHIVSLPEEFCHLQSLEHLTLHCDKLLSLPSGFGNLRNLRCLDLSHCQSLRNLPVSFRNLRLLEHLSLFDCCELLLMSEDFQHIRKLELLRLSYCMQVEELPGHITDQASLTELYLNDMKSLRELPINIGQLSRLRKMEIGSKLLTFLPPSLGDLSFLTHLTIKYCPMVECLPPSFENLSFLTHLVISECHKLKSLPSVGHLVHLEYLRISLCPISQVDFLAAPLPFALSNLKKIELNDLKVGNISISEGCCPRLERLDLWGNDELMEIESLPASLEWLMICTSGRLDKLPSFAHLTSLRELMLYECGRIEKIEGFENCTRLEILKVASKSEVIGIESLERMEKLRRAELRASEGSAIARCIQTIQKWPDEFMICTRAVPDAASLVNSLLPQNLVVVDSISKQKLNSYPRLMVQKSFSNDNAILLCFVIHSFSQDLRMFCISKITSCSMKMSEGKWVWIVLCTQHSKTELLTAECIMLERSLGDDDSEVEKGLVVRGEGEILVKAFHSLLSLLLPTP